ncbi:hypothetical protein JCM3775_007470 [Rhodotorula graminis]
MASLLHQLRALRSIRTPVLLPVPDNVASSSTSQHQPFHRLDACGFVVCKPDLAQVLSEQLCGALEQQAAGSCLPGRTVDMLQLALDDFHDKAPLSDYHDAMIAHSHVDLVRALEAVVPDLDVLVGISQQRTTRALAIPQRAVPAHDPQGYAVAARIKPDLTLARQFRPSLSEQAVVTIEVKTPSASEPVSGLFARTAQALQDGDVVRWSELEDADVRSVLKKEIVAAVSYGHNMFVLSDLYTYLVGAIVWTSTDQYHVVVSGLERVSPDLPDSSNFLLTLLGAFYDQHLALTAGLALEVRRRVDAATASQARRAPARAVGPSFVADSNAPPAPRRTSRNQSTVNGSTRCAGLTELFSSKILVCTYPDGTSFRARRVLTSPSPSPSPTPSSARTHSPTSSLTSSASSTSLPPNPSPRSSPVRLAPTSCRSTARIPSPDYALPIQLDSLVGAGLSSYVYSFTLDSVPCVAKVARRGLDAAHAVEREIFWSTRPDVAALARDDNLVLVEAVYEREGDGRPVLLMRDGGRALERWEELDREQSTSLVLSVLRLHQLAHLVHGDLAPRNVVVPVPVPSSSSSPASPSTRPPRPSPTPRLIDLGHATEHDRACKGRECAERASERAPHIPSSNAAAAAVHLRDLLATSSRARVYTCTLDDDDEPYVVKISRGEGADELEHEALLLARSEVRALGDDVAQAEAAFCTADGRIMLVERDGGDALEMWDDLTERQRTSLVLSVLRLHQLAHLVHGDLAPRNVVVPPPSSSPSSPSISPSTRPPRPSPTPRLIDLGHAAEHDQACKGRECAEVRQLVGELALEPLELDEVGRRAASEGLLW